MGRDVVKQFTVDMREIDEKLRFGSKTFKKAIATGLHKSAIIVEREAEDRAPKYTGQLSLTIGHYKVDPETAKLAMQEYGEVAGPESAIFRHPRWDAVELGTSVEYAQFVHQRVPFLTDAAAAKAGDIMKTMEHTVERAMKRWWKRKGKK